VNSLQDALALVVNSSSFGGGFSSAKTGYMSSAAIKAQANANQRAFDAILSKIGVSDSSKDTSTSTEIGILHIKLSFEALAKLYDNADARILSVELNKPVAWTTLTNSTALLNLAPAWNAGYRVAEQYIVIIDTGVRKNHAFFTTGGILELHMKRALAPMFHWRNRLFLNLPQPERFW